MNEESILHEKGHPVYLENRGVVGRLDYPWRKGDEYVTVTYNMGMRGISSSHSIEKVTPAEQKTCDSCDLFEWVHPETGENLGMGRCNDD